MPRRCVCGHRESSHPKLGACDYGRYGYTCGCHRYDAHHGNATLNQAQVREIRRLQGQKSAGAIAKDFRVGKSTIIDIWRGRTWRWVDARK